MRWILIGAGTLIVSAAIAVAVFTLLGGASLSKDKPKIPPLPALAEEEPQFPRSSAADLLENGSFDDMTPEQVASVKAEMERVFSNAEFRASTPLQAGIDTVRQGGRTRATRQYFLIERPNNKYAITELTSFWCDSSAPGFVDVFRSRNIGGTITTEGDRVADGTQPFQRYGQDTDWSHAHDLGFDEIQGHRVHGVQVVGLSTDGTMPVPERQFWIDVETAQLRYQLDIDGEKTTPPFTFDWHRPPHILAVPALGVPPCYPALYDDD